MSRFLIKSRSKKKLIGMRYLRTQNRTSIIYKFRNKQQMNTFVVWNVHTNIIVRINNINVAVSQLKKKWFIKNFFRMISVRNF